ncbi:MAG: tRNA pseudouridine(38-40) synthase TruA, partial [Geopsychrobacter sp.]|nr:tRNA pseudouridine(38-40) synthase TruA [Geopsychrobacter sp.]
VQAWVGGSLEFTCYEPVVIYSSGRTDAGVHALGMVAHFKTACLLPLSAYLHGVNHKLPMDISVRSVRRMSERFHARFSARGKWYRYHLYLSPSRSPLHDRFCWHYRRPLDVELMKQAAQTFVGEHDFAAFRGAGCSAKTTIRRIDSIDFYQDGEDLRIDVRGGGFLRHMIRMMVGTLVQIGAGKRPLGDIERLLQVPPEKETRLTAPAKGLCLQSVFYPDEVFEVAGNDDDYGQIGSRS